MNLNLVEIGKKLQLTLNLAIEGSGVRLFSAPMLTVSPGPGPRDFTFSVTTTEPEAGIYIKWWKSNVNGSGSFNVKLGNPLQIDSGTSILTDIPGMGLYPAQSFGPYTITAPAGFDYVYIKVWTLDDNSSSFSGQEAGWLQVSSSSSSSSSSGNGSTSGSGSDSGSGSASGSGSSSAGGSASGGSTSGDSSSGGSTSSGSGGGSSSLPPGSSSSN